MRYALAMALALVFGTSGLIHAAFAAEHEGPQATVSTVVTQYEPADPGSVAGPMTPSFQAPAVEHDLDRN